jgi:plastocyanin
MLRSLSRIPRLPTLASATGIILALAACSKQSDAPSASTPSESAPTASVAAAVPSSTPLTPAPGRHVIVIELTTDGTGSYFKPNEVEAKPGDVLRFTLGTGVHNVHFLPDSNPGKTGLPSASDLLQLPGQSVDIPVTFAPGKYYFQCDPHAALGMKGHLEVEEDKK